MNVQTIPELLGRVSDLQVKIIKRNEIIFVETKVKLYDANDAMERERKHVLSMYSRSDEKNTKNERRNKQEACFGHANTIQTHEIAAWKLQPSSEKKVRNKREADAE